YKSMRIFAFSAFVVSLSIADLASAAHDPIKIDQWITSMVAGESLSQKFYPTKWRREIENTSLNVNEILGTDYPHGIAYAAHPWKHSNVSFEKLKTLLNTKGGMFKICTAVKSQHNLKILSETDSTLTYQLDIKVPILDDFRTQAKLWTYIDKKGR